VNLHGPFIGTLYLPDTVVPSGTSPVMLSDGQTVAHIQWHMWTVRAKFEILDPQGAVVAEGGSEGFTASRYVVRSPNGAEIVHLQLGMFRPINGSTATLAGGRRLRARLESVWSERRFEVFADDDRMVGRIEPTTGVFSFRPDSYAFHLLAPVMSIVEAIGLAQALRAVTQAKRRRAHS